MKTPQEEAERLFHETVQPVMFFTETQQRLKRHLAETIPLTELIAVARAAQKRVRAIGYVEQTNWSVLERQLAIATNATNNEIGN